MRASFENGFDNWFRLSKSDQLYGLASEAEYVAMVEKYSHHQYKNITHPDFALDAYVAQYRVQGWMNASR